MIKSIERRKVYYFVHLNEKVFRTDELKDHLGVESFSYDIKENSSRFTLNLANGKTMTIPFDYYVAKDGDDFIVLSPKGYYEGFEALIEFKTN